MKVLTLLGTRPEIIRLSRVIPLLDQVVGRENHLLVHTGQNHDPALSADFFRELGLREPDMNLGASGTFACQMATIFPALEHTLTQPATRPDRLLVLGDTNSSLGAIVAARLGIPTFHMEAGNRSFAPPPAPAEEVNRRLVDHASLILLPYTDRSRSNLLAEGIHPSRIFVTGNPIGEVIEHYRPQWTRSDVLTRLGLTADRFFLVTLHRAENVDREDRLRAFLEAFDALSLKYSMPVIVSTHPRTQQRLPALRHLLGCFDTRFLPPFPFFDFLQLQSSAFSTLSDSGTVQEESCLLQRPLVCLRDSTERPETLEAGASVLSGSDPTRIVQLVGQVTEGKPTWTVPNDYVRPNVADTVCRILLSHLERISQ